MAPSPSVPRKELMSIRNAARPVTARPAVATDMAAEGQAEGKAKVVAVETTTRIRQTTSHNAITSAYVPLTP